MHPLVMTEIAKMRAAERRREACKSRRARTEPRFRTALGWQLVGAGLRLASSRAIVRRIEGAA